VVNERLPRSKKITGSQRALQSCMVVINWPPTLK
jgi:hypothetical protein